MLQLVPLVLCPLRHVRLAYQPPASSTFLSEQISHQQLAGSTFLSEQISTSHQPPAKRIVSRILFLTPLNCSNPFIIIWMVAQLLTLVGDRNINDRGLLTDQVCLMVYACITFFLR
jgi:hypothetical protein